ncbi:MAG: hypothetical protein ACRDRK_00600 [Pseudonocardia sp.]
MTAWGAAAVVVAVVVGRMIACRDRQGPHRRESERLSAPVPRQDLAGGITVVDRQPS